MPDPIICVTRQSVRATRREQAKSGFKFGILEGMLGEGPDWFEPMSEEELALWEGAGDDDESYR